MKISAEEIGVYEGIAHITFVLTTLEGRRNEVGGGYDVTATWHSQSEKRTPTTPISLSLVSDRWKGSLFLHGHFFLFMDIYTHFQEIE